MNSIMNFIFIILITITNNNVKSEKYYLRKYYNICDDVNCDNENIFFSDCINLCSHKGDKITCFAKCLSSKTSLYNKCCKK